MTKSFNKIALCAFTIGATALLFSVANASAATTVVANTAGQTLTVSDPTGGSGATLSFNPSPNILMQVGTLSNYYAINSMNVSAPNGSRNEYAVYSGMTGYYQGVNADATNITTASFAVTLVGGTDLTADPFSGTLTAMGGGGSGS